MMWNSASYRGADAELILAAIAFFTVGMCVDARATIVIDNFETAQAFSMTPGTGSPVINGIADPNSIGGFRVAALAVLNPPPTADHDLAIDDGGNGLLTFTGDPADEARATLNYFGDDMAISVMTPGIDIDLSTDSVIEIVTRSNVAAAGSLFVFSSSADSSRWNFLFPGNGLITFETISIDLATTPPDVSTGAGAILSSVAALSFVIDYESTPGGIVQIDSIQATAVPEPSCVAFAGVVLACGAGLSKLLQWRQSRRNS
jgi:hypothetical protein